MKCPTCGSPNPKLHPAMQFEGEVQICDDAFHESHSGRPRPGETSACLPADESRHREARSNPSTRSDSKSETADHAGGQQQCLGSAGEHGALDTRSVLTPRLSSSNDYCRKCGSFDIVPYVR